MPAFNLREDASALTVSARGVDIARYELHDRGTAFEGRRPYLHPLRTLAGTLVTALRPWDHRWHKGLNFSLTDVSGHNFWGGNTYVPGSGYQALGNVGSIRSQAVDVQVSGADLTLGQSLLWLTSGSEPLLTEERTLRFHSLDGTRGLWGLDVTNKLTNTGGSELVLGSPTTNGRGNAGYSGLTLRLARSFTGGVVSAPDGVALPGQEADRLMGTGSPWLAFGAQCDEVDGAATALLFGARSSTGSPAHWYVRCVPFPILGTSPTFHEPITLGPGQQISFAHRLVLLDSLPNAREIAALAVEFAPG